MEEEKQDGKFKIKVPNEIHKIMRDRMVLDARMREALFKLAGIDYKHESATEFVERIKKEFKKNKKNKRK